MIELDPFAVGRIRHLTGISAVPRSAARTLDYLPKDFPDRGRGRKMTLRLLRLTQA